MQSVEIPAGLARQLDAMGNHFLLIDGKVAREKEWNIPKNLMRSDNPKLVAWLRNGGNYGVAGGAGVTIVEADNPEVVERMKQLPAKTFMVKSGGKGLPHYYLKCSTEGNRPLKIWENNPATDMGYIKAESGYVVGPNSIHPDTQKRYEVICDAEMLQISSKVLYTLLDSWIKKKTVTSFKTPADNQYYIPIASIMALDNLIPMGPDEYRGPHPFHGSPKTGMNFKVDLKTNTWRCWACDVTGDGLNLFAQKENMIKCGELLRGEKFKLALQKARTQGLLPEKETVWKTFWDFCKEDEKGKKHFVPPLFADYLMTQYTFKTARKTTKGETSIYVYNPLLGIYTETGPDVIEEEMAKIFNEQNRKRYYSDVEFHIQGSTKFDRPEIDAPEIACYNGLLNPSTGEFTAFTPDKFILIQIPITYVPSLKCPKIIKVITEILGEDGLKPFQEFLGYCLYNRYKFHRSQLLIGDGANGKSTLINLIKRFLGKNNVLNISLQELCSDRFTYAELYGKLANVFADLPNTSLKVTGPFKIATGGDSKSAARKFKTLLTFENRAKFVFSCNEIPETSDDTTAFFRRWILLPCDNSFPPEKANPHILDEICTPNEMSGLLNWGLQGLQRLLRNGAFTEAKNVTEKRKQWFRGANTAEAFIDENLEASLDPNDYLYDTALYKYYVRWCKANGLRTRMKGHLTQTMRTHFGITRGQRTVKLADKTEIKPRTWPYVRFIPTITASLLMPHEKNGFIEYKYEGCDSGAKPPNINGAFLTCEYCRQRIYERESRTNDPGTHKPVHMKCYREWKKGQKKEAE